MTKKIKVNIKKVIYMTILLSCTFVLNGLGATWNSNVAAGAWNTAGSWTTSAGTPNLGANANNWAIIRNGHTITRTGMLRFGVRGNIEVQDGGTLHVTGDLEFDGQAKIYVRSGGTLIVNGKCRGNSGTGNAWMQNTSLLQIDEGATATFGGNINPGQGSDLIFNGNVTVNASVLGDGAGTTITVGANADLDINGNLTVSNNVVAHIYGDVEVNNLTSSGGGSPYNLYSGTTTVNSTITINNNGKVHPNTGGGGTIYWGSTNINSDCSSAFMGCKDGTKFDTNTSGGCPQNWPTPAGNSLNLATCGPACVAIVPGTIATAQTICQGDDVAAFTSTVPASGGDATNYTYQWQSSTTSAVAGFANNGLPATITYNHGVLATTTWFRRNVTSGVCGNDNTSAIEVTVAPTSVGGSIAAATSVCEGTNGATLTLSGHTGTITRWESNVEGAGWTDIGNGATATLAYLNLTDSTKYRAIVTSGSCPAATSAEVDIDVAPTSVAGTISSAATVCNGNNGATISLAGNTGTVTRWEYKAPSTGNVWTAIGASTGLSSISYTNLTENTDYRAVIASGVCASANTNEILITVVADISAGTVAAAQTINHGDTPAALTSTVAAAGGGGFTYQWQSSTNGTTWANVVGATLATYAPGALNNDTWYRRAAIPTASCNTVYTTSVKITIEVNVGCGSAPPPMTNVVTPTGGNGSYTYQWQSSPDGITWSDIPSETSATFTPSTISATTYYRRGVSSGRCGPLYTPGKLATFTGGAGGSPGGVGTGLLVWLKADAGTGSIGTQWDDQSGNGHHYTTVTGPTVSNAGDSASNFQPYIEITSGGFDAPAGAELGANYTIFAAGRKLASDANGNVFDSHSGNHQFGFTSNNILKKVELITGTAAAGTRVDINQGNSGQTSHAHIYELVIYNSALTLAQKKQIRSYLATKYGIKDDSDNYVTSTSVVTYDVGTNTQYNNDIIGLGKECYFHQKQSKTADDSTYVWISTLAATNASNVGTVTNDVSYLMVGHDGAKNKGTAATSAEIPAGAIDGVTILSRIDREWKVTNTNFADEFTLKIETELNEASLTMDDIVLLVDDDGDFSNGGTNAYYNTDAGVHGADNFTISQGSFKLDKIGTGIIAPGATKFITIASKDAASPLPVELLSFTVSKNGEYTNINWVTATEINNDYFSIEKSDDGVNWYSIGIMGGAGNSSKPIDYSFIDYDGCNVGICYYRLQQVDLDGTSDFSQIKSIDNIAQNVVVEVKAYPNPTKSILNVEFTNNKLETVDIKIYDAIGQEVYDAKLVSAEGKNNFKLTVDNLTNGIYYIKITDFEGQDKGSTSFNKI